MCCGTGGKATSGFSERSAGDDRSIGGSQICRQLQHNSGRLSGGVTADYVLQLKGSANDEPKVSTTSGQASGAARGVPRSQRAATPVDSHLVDRRTGTDRDVLACHWLDLAGIASLCPPAKLRNVDHPPAAVAGDVDIEAGHWSLSDEAVGVFTHEHEIGKAPVQRFVRSCESWPLWSVRLLTAARRTSCESATGSGCAISRHIHSGQSLDSPLLASALDAPISRWCPIHSACFICIRSSFN